MNRGYGQGENGTMTHHGRVRNGQIVLDEPGTLPEGAVVRIEVVESEAERPTIWEELLKIAGSVEGLPSDASRNHDHYLYGTPKQP